ncbi:MULTISPECIES: methyl-accepting chemotaxis protein [unclassified Sphingomonas]|uniref:methyl-accepting chemotaxis protein n=1 Tax=unclassified Sphingomonas TaxID=196159 RepID=UPI00082B24D3|nr:MULTISPECIES: methyl-accepting chemotaxis protein [unclassified Sphingomonas]MCH4892602.1 hypothetical protein [Sphingomonas sp. SFZ2018-12]
MTRTGNAIEETSRALGALVINCADIAGQLGQVSSDISEQSVDLGGLSRVVDRLVINQQAADHAAAQTRKLSDQVRSKLEQNAQAIEEATSSFGELTTLVSGLGAHVTDLSNAMSEVRSVSDVIARIATQTNLLALNAAIEAARAGVEGRGFGVVAAAVKGLASETREATRRIDTTIDVLSGEASRLVQEIEHGMMRSLSAERGLARIRASMVDAGEIITMVDGQSAEVTEAVAGIEASVAEASRDIAKFADALRINAVNLSRARARVDTLEVEANLTLDRLAMSGLETGDTPSIERAKEVAREIERLVEAGIARGEVSEDAVFDCNYRLIPGSNPPRYDTGFNDFADRHIRPILDRESTWSPGMIGSVISDVNGYLPTHLTLRSQRQGKDIAWNMKWCRDRRIMMDDATRRAIESSAPAMLNCYRMALGEEDFLPLKTVFVPLWFRGRRWGNFEFAYVDAQDARSLAIGASGLAESLVNAGDQLVEATA